MKVRGGRQMINNLRHDFLIDQRLLPGRTFRLSSSKQYQFLLRKVLVSSILLVRPPMLSHNLVHTAMRGRARLSGISLRCR